MNVSEELVRSIAEKIAAEAADCSGKCDFQKQVDPSGVMGIKVSTVKPEPFEGRDNVRLRDISTLEEAPRMSCGIMELSDGADFDWTLTYDEWDIILEGRLEIKIDGRIVGGDAGDVIYIPKGSHIHFSTPSYAKFACTTYPAD